METPSIETAWSLDLDIIEKLAQVSTGFHKVADAEEDLKKKDPFKESAKKAVAHNRELLESVRTYNKIASSAKFYETEVKRLTAVQVELNRRTKEFKAAGQYKELQKELQKTEAQLKRLNAEKAKFDRSAPATPKINPGSTPKTGGSGIPVLGGVGKNIVGQLGGLAAGLFAVDKAFDLIVKGPAEFGRALSNLSAITGATGKDLKFLETQAIEFERATGKSAQSMLEAFQVVGSVKPELLENKQLLVETTKEVVALQDAAGNISLEDAANSLLGSLNQFNAGADQASRFVNVLAAGAKAGSSEIVDTSQAFKTAGTALASANLSFEESNALVQTLAGVMIKGGEAGTALRNVILKLESSADKNLRPSVVGLDLALENASKKFNTTTKLSKEFGVENIVAARRILETRTEVQKLTKDLTGTDVAYQQQATNLDNLATDLDKAGTAFTGFFRNLGQSQAGFLRFATQAFTNFFNALSDKSTDYKALIKSIFIPTQDNFLAISSDSRKLNERKVQETGIRQRAGTDISSAIGQETARLMKEKIPKGEAEVKAAQEILKREVDQLEKSRKFYEDTQARFLKATTTEEKAALVKDSKADALSIKESKVRVETAQKQLEQIQKAGAGRAKALAEALEDQKSGDDKAGKKAAKILDKQQQDALKLRETYLKQLQDLENDYEKERLESLGKDSTKYLQERARIDLQLIDQDQAAFLKLKQQMTGANNGKFDKTGNPIADESIELTGNEIDLFARRKEAVLARLQMELDKFYAEHIDEEQKHQDQVNQLVGSEYDQQIEQVRQKYAEVLKLVKKDSADEIRLTKAKNDELKKIELSRKLNAADKTQSVAESGADLKILKAQSSGNFYQEIQAQIKALEVRKNGIQNKLNLLAEFGTPEDLEQIDLLADEIEKLGIQIENLNSIPARNIWDIIGIGGKGQAFIQSLQPVADAIQNYADISLQVSEQRVAQVEKEIDAKKKQIDAETALNKEGVANNLALREQELSQLQIQRQKALLQQRQAQKLANAQESAAQVAAMITASTNIIKTSSVLGPLGPVVAGAAIALMFGMYTASKIKARQLAKMQDADNYREGGWLDGPDHEHGGMNVQGTNMYLEGGEHVTKKRRAVRFPNLLEAVNEGAKNRRFPVEELRTLAAEGGYSVAFSNGTASLKELNTYIVSRTDSENYRTTSGQLGNDEMLTILRKIYDEQKLLTGKSDFVHNGKHYQKVGLKKTITVLDS